MFLLIVASWMAVAGVVVGAQTKAPASAAAPAVTDWQTAAGGKMEFDVASVKENKGGFTRDNFPYSNFPWDSTPTYLPNGGHFVGRNMGLTDMIAFAYKLTGQQANFMLRPKLPAWALNERFDIEARAPQGPEPKKDQMRLMVQALLADRFQLRLHFETKEGTVHILRLMQPGVMGPKLTKHPADVPCTRTWSDGKTPEPPKPADGLPVDCSYIQLTHDKPELLRYGARAVAINELAKVASLWYNDGRPVLEQTGLQGTYDFTLEFAPPIDVSSNPNESIANGGGLAPPAPSVAYADQHGAYGPELVEALKKQLGMKLETGKGPVQSLVIDQIEYPSSN